MFAGRCQKNELKAQRLEMHSMFEIRDLVKVAPKIKRLLCQPPIFLEAQAKTYSKTPHGNLQNSQLSSATCVLALETKRENEEMEFVPCSTAPYVSWLTVRLTTSQRPGTPIIQIGMVIRALYLGKILLVPARLSIDWHVCGRCPSHHS